MTMSLKGKSGFTLIEIVLTIAVMGIILVPISILFMNQYKITILETKRVQAQSDTSQALQFILSDLKKYEAPNSLYDSDGNLVKIADGLKLKIKDNILYYVENGVLMRNTDAICKNIRDFSITEISEGNESNVIEIDFTVYVNLQDQSRDIRIQSSYRRKLPNKR